MTLRKTTPSKRESQVLRALRSYRGKFGSGLLAGVREPGWCRPRDIGGTRDSHHSLSLRRLVLKGLAETRTIDDGPWVTSKPLRLYRAIEK